MTDREFKRLSRSQLIEIIYQFQLKQDELIAENERLSRELADKRLRIAQAGNIAEATLAVNNVMQGAQNAAQQYLDEIHAMRSEAEAECRRMREHAKAEADAIIAQARKEAATVQGQPRKNPGNIVTQLQKKVTGADAQVQKKQAAADVQMKKEEKSASVGKKHGKDNDALLEEILAEFGRGSK